MPSAPSAMTFWCQVRPFCQTSVISQHFFCCCISKKSGFLTFQRRSSNFRVAVSVLLCFFLPSNLPVDWQERAVCLCYFYSLSQFKLQKNIRATSGWTLQPQHCKSSSTASSDFPPRCCKLTPMFHWSINSLQMTVFRNKICNVSFTPHYGAAVSVCYIQHCGFGGKLTERTHVFDIKLGIFFPPRITSFIKSRALFCIEYKGCNAAVRSSMLRLKVCFFSPLKLLKEICLESERARQVPLQA